MFGADLIPTQISTVPRLSQRLECMLYRRKLELEVEEIRPDMQTVRDACKELRGSERFKAVLQVCCGSLRRVGVTQSVKRLSLPWEMRSMGQPSGETHEGSSWKHWSRYCAVFSSIFGRLILVVF